MSHRRKATKWNVINTYPTYKNDKEREEAVLKAAEVYYNFCINWARQQNKK